MHSVLKSYRASTGVYRAVSKFVVLLPSDGGPQRRVRGMTRVQRGMKTWLLARASTLLYLLLLFYYYSA